MRLLLKFSAIFALVFCVGIAVIGWLSYGLMQEAARAQVLEQARLMMQAALSVRTYTTIQLKPLLEPTERKEDRFLPQTVPAFAATENFNDLQKTFPDYSYKEAALNPTNPRDRAVDWEADIINAFRNKPQLKELIGEREASTGPSLFFARPLRAGADCMGCHSVPLAAPKPMLALYGASNGFGWEQGSVIAAQIVSVPMAVPLQIARDDFRAQLIYLGSILLISLVVLNVALYFTIARPVARLSEMADKISLGQFDVPELPIRGKDEIARLAGSFNRMRRSLVTAMRMLDSGGQ
jgi:HAMP domain-containing protein